MSESMIERVAKALCKAADDDWDWSVFYIVDARDTAETGRDLYREMARAAIEAIRDPSPEMMDAYTRAFVSEKRFDGAEVYRSMIDTALKGGE